jgi:thioredoxin reductase/SAM-dependent methyltransferase
MDEIYDVVVVGGGPAGLSGALALSRAGRSVLVVDAGDPRNAPAGHVHNYLAREGVPPADLLAAGRAEVAGYGGEVVAGRAVGARVGVEGEVAPGQAGGAGVGDGGEVVAGQAVGAGAGDGGEVAGRAVGAGVDSEGEVVAGRAVGVGGEAVTAHAVGGGFTVTLDDGRVVRGRRLLVTTGLVDELPDVPGLVGRWGRDVLHCPYCHGHEVRDRRIGVLAGGPLSVEQANLWRQWSPHVTLLTHDTPAPSGDEAERLAAREIAVVAGPVASLEVAGDVLTGVRLTSGEVVGLDALVVAPRFTARAGVLESLGLKPVDVEHGGQVVGSQIPADPAGGTDVPGVWVAGNVGDVRAQVITSAAAGLNAAAAINADLVAEDTRVAVADYRHRRDTMFEEEAWEERYRAHDSIWSGRPNPQLVAEVAGLPPGRALDVGSGEGADAVWLASRGWQVTGVDISTVALARAAAHAEAAGPEVAGRITWTHADLRAEGPEGRYDLVSSQFMHLPSEVRRDVFARLAAAVAPGGILLIVGHHPSDLRLRDHRMHFPDMLYPPEEIAAALDPAEWEVLTAETRVRTGPPPGGGADITVNDAVLVARRSA